MILGRRELILIRFKRLCIIVHLLEEIIVEYVDELGSPDLSVRVHVLEVFKGSLNDLGVLLTCC